MAEQGGAPEEPSLSEAEKRAVRERVLRILFTSEARQRLTNIKMVKPDVAKAVEDRVLRLASAGKINKAVSDEELKQLLGAINQQKREFKIRWA